MQPIYLDYEDVQNAITERTILITIMHANNEVGTIQPILDACPKHVSPLHGHEGELFPKQQEKTPE